MQNVNIYMITCMSELLKITEFFSGVDTIATSTCTECRRPSRARSWPPIQHHNTSERPTLATGQAPHHLQNRNSDASSSSSSLSTVLGWPRSAQPTFIGSSAPIRPEQPRYRELGPSSEDGLSLSAVPTCGTVFLPNRRLQLVLPPCSKLICSSLCL